MKHTLTLSIAAIAALVGSAAQAQPARDEARPGGERTREQAALFADRMFERIDANDDGQLDEADREARQRARFDRLDADGNGALTFAEMQDGRTRGRERMAASHGDGDRATAPGAPRRGMAGMRGGMRNLARTADADENGAISQDEFRLAALARFDSADANADGTVSADERRAHRDQMRAYRRGDSVS